MSNPTNLWWFVSNEGESMSNLATLMQQYVEHNQLQELEGDINTDIPGVKFFRHTQATPKSPFVYESGIIILGQGYKKITIGNEHCVTYGPNDYLVAGVPMPLECEAFASQQEPILGLNIHIDHTLLMRMVSLLDEHGMQYCAQNNKGQCGVQSVQMNARMLSSCERVMHALLSPVEAKVLSQSLIDDILFCVLTGTEGHVLVELARYEGHYARIAKALAKIHSHYSEPLSVQLLSEVSNMSVSAFHHAFRAVTMESPLQYLKKVRLNKARQLIQVEGLRVTEAAMKVGYVSPSQFSREFKRHFNQTPKGQSALSTLAEPATK